MPEILAPVGNWKMLTASIDAGCDAIYFGVEGFNMRATAGNFSLKEIKTVIDYCHQNKIKAYCTINIIIYEKELEQLTRLLKELKKSKVDAIICWDLAVIRKAKELGLTIHLSTQASVSNSISAQQWKEFGITRVILARECSLEDAKKIKENTGVEIEIFIHGARCISLSGRCFMSQELFGKSANRGECLQPCRREYLIKDDEGKEMKLKNNFVMSAKDLCALPLLNKLHFVDCIKIEGRNRGAQYVSYVVSVYRKALDAINKGNFNKKLINELMEKLKKVYNKDFSKGYLIDYPHHQRCDKYGSKATTQKILLGKISNFYSNLNVAEFKVESSSFSIEDNLCFEGNTTGYKEMIVKEICDDSGKIKKAEKGQTISVKVDFKLRKNDQVYLIKKISNTVK